GGVPALSGTKLFVPDAHTADAIVVAARTGGGAGEDGVRLFLVPRTARGVEGKLLPPVDRTRTRGGATPTDVTLGPEALLGAPGLGWKPLERVLERACVALCAEMGGGAQNVLHMRVEHDRSRQAFAKPIGSYQGVKHKAADMLVDVENSKSITYYAAWAMDESSPEGSLAVSMAKASVSHSYSKVSA